MKEDILIYIDQIHFSIGQTVYLKTDPEQKERMVIGIDIRPNGIMYLLSLGDFSSYHFDLEISKDKDLIKGLQ